MDTARPRTADHAKELARIKDNYRARDAIGIEDRYRQTQPGSALYIQLIEWSLLRAVRTFELLSEANVLDVGCGSGYFANRLVEFGAATATGVDLMEERIQAARTRYPALRFDCGNAAELRFDDGVFHIVTQFMCLSSVTEPSLRRAIAEEMWRVTRPGGFVLSYDMRPEPPPLRARRERRLRRARRVGASVDPLTPTVALGKEELRRLFPDAAMTYSSAALDFELCSIAQRSYVAAQVLASVGWLRGHALAVMRKPLATQAA